MKSVKQNLVNLEFCTSYLGVSHESYMMELSLNDGAPLSVIRHALPYFIPVDQLAAEFCTDASETACQRFVWAIYRYLHAFVARRQEAIFAKVSCTCQTVALPKFCINPCTWDLLYVLLRY